MHIRKKTSIEQQKQAAEKNLSIRLELLKSKGWDDKRIKKDAKVRQFKAQCREQKKRLTGIAGMEALTLRKTETKAKKIEALKSALPKNKKKKAATAEAPKKVKKERKIKAASEE